MNLIHGYQSLDHRYRYLFLLIIIFTSLITYLPGSQIPALFGDDWGFIADHSNQLTCPKNLNDIRPLDQCVGYLLRKLVPLNVDAYHIALLLLNIVVPILFFYFLENLFLENSIINFLITEILIVFPTDINHNWYNIINYRVVAILMLMGGIFFLKYWRNSGWKNFVISQLFFIISIGVYEIHLGLLVFGSFLTYLFPKNKGTYYRIGLLAPIGIALATSIWRLLIPQTNYGGWALSDIDTSPIILYYRMIYFLRINLYFGWSSILEEFIRYNLGSLSDLFFITILVILTFILTLAISRKYPFSKIQHQLIAPYMKNWLKMLLLGLVLMIVGYLPIMIITTPVLNFANSRLHIMASFGGAIICVAILGILVVAFQNQGLKALIILSFLVLFFVFIGIINQWNVNYFETKTAWEEQKHIWKAILKIAPNITPETTVVLILPDKMESAKISPIQSGPFGFSSALSTFYGRDDIRGYFQYSEIKSEQITSDGFKSIFQTYPPIPYESLLLLKYDWNDRTITIVKNLEDGKSENKNSILLCDNCIIDIPYERQLDYIVR